MKNITKIVFFDVDGVILDSLEIGYQGTVSVFTYEGITPPSKHEYLTQFDARTSSTFYYSRGVKMSKDEIWEHFLKYFDSHEHSLFEEVYDVLQSIKKSGIKMYFVTFGRSKSRVISAFKKHNIHDLFEGGGFGYERKDGYMIEVLKRLGISNQNAVMVGDQPSDVIDAHRANLRLRVAVARDEVFRIKFDSHPYTHIIKNLKELPDIL